MWNVKKKKEDVEIEMCVETIVHSLKCEQNTMGHMIFVNDEKRRMKSCEVSQFALLFLLMWKAEKKIQVYFIVIEGRY